MSHPPSGHSGPHRLKYLSPEAVRAHLERDPRLIIPVGTTEQHGPHLPLGIDTILIERLAGDLSAEFGVLLAPTVEYGVNARTRTPYPGNATLRRKTLHRFMNDLVGSWEEGGVRSFVILTAHDYEPHQEALGTLRTRGASLRTVDIFSARMEGEVDDARHPIHGGLIDTSLLLYIDQSLVTLESARDFVPPAGRLWRRSRAGTVPAEGPGSVGYPTRASIEMGRRLYHLIYERIAARIFGRPDPSAPTGES